MKKSKLFLILLLVTILTIVVIVLVQINMGIFPLSIFNKDNERDYKISRKGNMPKVNENGKIDDWCYEPSEYDSYYGNISGGGATSPLMNSFSAKDTSGAGSNGFSSKSVQSNVNNYQNFADSEATLGYSVGGAKDINNFRENISNGYFPLETDITYEGIYYDYSFDTGNANSGDSSKMFYPTFSTAVSKDPISNKDEYYVSVGLNSNIKESDFQRKKLNVVLVLDISGSMSSSIKDYYYDANNNEDEKEFKSKMKLAEESINILLDQLNPEDSVGVVLFDNIGYLAKPLNLVGDTDIDAIKEHILDVEAMGGTNFEAGYNIANEVFDEYGIGDADEYENRIIVITDAMPNIGETSSDGLRKLMDDNAKKGIYTSFIGVGVDFNSEVIKNIADVRGANYYSVSNEKEFNARMGDEFEYMVTPLVFDLNMDIEADGFEIEKVYGTDSIDSEKSNIMHVNTLFPSKTNEDGEVKGGIIILKLKKTDENKNKLALKVSYETRDGKKDSTREIVEFNEDSEYYDNTGIRKGILLARYVNLIKNWTKYERDKNDRYLITPIIGIFDYYDNDNDYNNSYNNYYSENERISVNLSVSEKYKVIFSSFRDYFRKEMNEINDNSLVKEVKILDKIIDEG